MLGEYCNAKSCSAAYCISYPVLAISSPAVRVLISPFRNRTPPVRASKTPRVRHHSNAVLWPLQDVLPQLLYPPVEDLCMPQTALSLTHAK